MMLADSKEIIQLSSSLRDRSDAVYEGVTATQWPLVLLASTIARAYDSRLSTFRKAGRI